ncbi:hypothetical protein ARMGADRAFT_1039447 [Armillaria gallica]|uniref:Uncharacterized protein n=1 Tax=Armillaria gallica TaxID=47427 RepID=A0A2H3CYX8_ARMGA|nr:hypothetical protein ARMGADRAFT_1039447 [Armillaria gallica]
MGCLAMDPSSHIKWTIDVWQIFPIWMLKFFALSRKPSRYFKISKPSRPQQPSYPSIFGANMWVKLCSEATYRFPANEGTRCAPPIRETFLSTCYALATNSYRLPPPLPSTSFSLCLCLSTVLPCPCTNYFGAATRHENQGRVWARFLTRDDVSRSGERGYDGEEREDGADRRGSRLDGDASPTKPWGRFLPQDDVSRSGEQAPRRIWRSRVNRGDEHDRPQTHEGGRGPLSCPLHADTFSGMMLSPPLSQARVDAFTHAVKLQRRLGSGGGSEFYAEAMDRRPGSTAPHGFRGQHRSPSPARPCT